MATLNLWCDAEERRERRERHRVAGRLLAGLDVDPAAISEETRFKEDLEADSLDLYTLVQEFEDTYGVRISDEDAATILTVGQAIDYVIAHTPPES